MAKVRVSVKEIKAILNFVSEKNLADNTQITIKGTPTGIGDVITISYPLSNNEKIVKDISDYDSW